MVEAAKSKDSPLHNKFEWDDGEAAEKYRLIQARMMISISVQYLERGDKMVPTKVFVSLSTDRHRTDGAGYRTFVDVMAHPDMKNQLLMDSLQAMTHFQEKYKALQELGEVFDAIEKAKQQIQS